MFLVNSRGGGSVSQRLTLPPPYNDDHYFLWDILFLEVPRRGSINLLWAKSAGQNLLSGELYDNGSVAHFVQK
ncbi:hypothetical protein DP117_28455 [Brasilonema sp. UFV-L1]|nr:hypothetical protein [Brasilonema sp. UFV-L1]